MGDVSTKTVSFKKLSGKDKREYEKLEKVDLELIFVPKTGLFMIDVLT